MPLMPRRIRGLHVYTGDEYKVTRGMLNDLEDRGINTFVIQLGHPDAENVRFDYQRRSNASRAISRSIGYLEDFLRLWNRSRLMGYDFYVSLPALHNNQDTISKATYFYSDYIDYMAQVKNTIIDLLGRESYETDFAGFLFRTESIYPIQEKISASDPYSTPMVKLLNDLAYRVRSRYDVNFMWTPYYGYGPYRENIAHNIGVIANRTNIFDVICIQPATYYHSAPSRNVDLVFESAGRDEVIGVDGAPVARGKRSSATALIGVNMEADNNFNRTKRSIFNQYVNTFDELVKRRNVPFVFYANSLQIVTGNSDLLNAIEDFYNLR